ncbi:DUF3299 domain-containing protein [Azonexus sp. IMCC34839]|uniref:DUF3299 domain-containing protein n=1 Tax=Azonexus sp. IMCC34839 TaxID=3133695 RepID=UPI00399A2EDC
MRHILLCLIGLLLGAPALHAQDYRVGERLKPIAKPAHAGYREVKWEDLQPKDWDPMAGFKNLNLGRLKDSDPRAQEALEKMRAAWDAAPVEPSLDGKKIRIPGFIVPLERKGDLVAELLLVPYFGACIHTPPPPANQAIHVILAQPVAKLRMMDAFWINGTLKVARGDSGMGVYGYRLKADTIEPYQFKREP